MDTCNYRTLCHSEIISILENKIICCLSTSLNDTVDTIPMWYIFEEEDKNLTIFFISKSSKTTVNNVKNNAHVCIFLDNSISNFYRDAYQTLIVKGNAEILTNKVQQNYIFNEFKKKYHKSLRNISCPSDLEYIKVSITDIDGREYNYCL